MIHLVLKTDSNQCAKVLALSYGRDRSKAWYLMLGPVGSTSKERASDAYIGVDDIRCNAAVLT